MSTKRQAAYLRHLIEDLGETVSPEKLAEFEAASIHEATAELTRLGQRLEAVRSRRGKQPGA
jgi:hypothetical protein